MTTTTAARDTPALPKLRALASAAVLALALAAAAALDIAGRASSDPAALAARVVDETCEAFRVGDAAALERILDDRYTLVSSTGEVTDKAEQLARARAVRKPGSVRVRDIAVRVDGTTAIAVGVLGLRAADGTPRTLRFTETLVAADGT
jgi:hypothetical protein